MGLFVSSKSAATRHGVFAIEATPPPVILAQGTGRVALVGQFPWGPKDEILYPSGPADLKMKLAPPGMSRTGSGYLSLIGKAFPDIVVVRVLGSASAAATSTLTDSPTNICTVTAKYHGTAGNSLTAVVSDASDGDANHFNLLVSITGASGKTEDFIQNFNASATGTQTTLTQADKDKLNLVGDVTILNDGRPDNGTYTFSSGADGTIDGARYVGTAGSPDRGIALLEGDPSINVVIVDDPGNSIRATVNAGLVAHATLMGDRVVVINGNSGAAASAAQSDVASYRDSKVIYVDPWVYIYDDTTGAQQLVPPSAFMASVLSQLSPSTSPAWKNQEVRLMLGGIVKLESSRGGSQISSNTAKGICTIIKEDDGGFTFEAGVNTAAPTDAAKRLITRTRMLQYIARALTSSLRGQVDAPNVQENRDNLVVATKGFMFGLKQAQNGDPNHTPHVVDYLVQPLAATNTALDYAAGDVSIGLEVQTSSQMERIFFIIKGGETPIVTAQGN